MSISVEAYRNLGTTEHQLQVSVVKYVGLYGRKGVRAIAIPNEGKRSNTTGARMRDRGLAAGMPDLLIVLPGKLCAWIELKRSKTGRMSVEQKGVHAWLTSIGHDVCVAYTLDEAIEFLGKVGALRNHRSATEGTT